MMKLEKGMALITALILIVPLTLLSIGLMHWSRFDLLMTGAAASNLTADQYTSGVLQRTLAFSTLPSTISSLTSSATSLTVTDNDGNSAAVSLALINETNCVRSETSSSTNVISACRYVTATNTKTFGKNSISTLTKIMGIEQPLVTATTSE